AARVDGCGYLGAFVRVVLPVSVPGVLTAVIFAFTLSMQDFLYGLAFVAPGDQKPVPVGVPTELIRGDVYYWGSLMGAALLVGLPVAVLYNFFLDRFIQGITGGVGKEHELARAARPLRPARRAPSLFGLGLLNGIGAAAIADRNEQVLHRLVGLVRVVVPPAAVVHERLPGCVVLRAGDAYRTRLVERRQDSLDYVHEGRHAKLLSPGLTAGLERHGRAG